MSSQSTIGTNSGGVVAPGQAGLLEPEGGQLALEDSVPLSDWQITPEGAGWVG